MNRENVNLQEEYVNVLDSSNDSTGLAEIQKALAEIEKLDQSNEVPRNEPNRAPHEEPSLEQSNGHTDLNESGAEAEEESQRKSKTDWKKTKQWYAAQAEIVRLHQENEKIAEANGQLQKHLNEALNVGTYHYGKSIYGELETAKEAKDKAIDEGDKKGLIEADIKINRIVNKIDELEKWETSNTTSSPLPLEPSRSLSPSTEVYQEIAHDWLDSHPYLRPNSKEYDVNLATKVTSFVNQLDHTLAREGRSDLFYSPQYFETIDRQIEALQNSETRKNNEPSSYVGGVRNSYGSTSGRNSSPNQILLSADEKRMAYNAGIKEEDWLKHKIAANKR